ncbi:hypothetical protein PGT21_029971 [Puccinia graminis f. sp. tritici]|uniref:DNA 3'-5' helicase n=1 Tax=Puccinia graminis f. sp. tritici TaxID=56615 RepID=A0A5B0PDX1_PUCGR|nr:hypothetical protein PGT21_029971 [Puccinia graminis f. sp. tritici]KAA1099253.1 hypothetical protein PGTUg99_025659 [Puccinia graminis f. sp. tritici]
MEFDRKIALEIRSGAFNFVYLSPEIFLNSALFKELYYDEEFQDRLATIVIDKAHIIYSWGLVDSGKAKKSSAHKRTEDVSIFRPSYGDMGAQLSATEGVPLLLLSATCRPVAVEKILKCLKLTEDTVDFVRGELTRPEIRILRVVMARSLKSTRDLLPVIEKLETPEDKIAPTLIYSGSRKATFQVMKMVNNARDTPGHEYNPYSPMIRRYHANTGDLAKVDSIEAFTDGKFPYVSCTMALGLGQNWKKVRKVIHMGRGDPSNICQMIGRCGRDGRPGLAVLFVEKNRRNGKNHIEDFENVKEQTDDIRMDALAVTPVCLRIAFSLDNLHGYIPMSTDDEKYLEEKKREIEEGFPTCRCSNCFPDEATQLYENMRELTLDNFSDAVLNPAILPIAATVPFDSIPRKRRPARKDLSPVLLQFSESLLKEFEKFFWVQFPEAATFSPKDLFNFEQAKDIARHIPEIKEPDDILDDIGGGSVEGQQELLYDYVVKFREGDAFHSYLIDEETNRTNVEIEKKKKRQESRARANTKTDEQIHEEQARLAEKHAASEIETARKLIAAEKRKTDAANRRAAAEKKKEDSKRKWEEDRVYLEGYKKAAREKQSSQTEREIVKKPKPKRLNVTSHNS